MSPDSVQLDLDSQIDLDSQNFALRTHSCLAALSTAFESGAIAKTALLVRLQAALTEAIEAYELTTQQDLDQKTLRLEQQAHVQWLCNQCTYYLSEPVPVESKMRSHRALWQIRGVVWALARFRLIVHLRSFFPGQVPTSLAWRDILPGFKLWLHR